MTNIRDIFERAFAAKSTRKQYEAALGAFLVRYNGIENYVRFLIETTLAARGKQSLWEKLKGEDLIQQLRYLELLSISEQGLATLPYQAILELNTRRNAFAHGHFQQDMFSDAFEVVGKNKSLKSTLKELNSICDKADEIWNELGSAISTFCFDENGEVIGTR